ncbi:MAG: 4Fe-4S dicluster domain-containing protein [Eubacterium sp.]|nr:4Fe-4S dicluster domain-containing protein [Eubacterium sp.]
MPIMNFSFTALKNLFSKPATANYPAVPREYPERSRGHVEINIDDCIMCGLCSRKCMSGAITIDRANKTWSIERMGCVQCGACVNACPKKCLSIVPGYSAPSTEKTVDSYSQPIPETKPGKITNDMSKCILCGLCARKCPQECITVDRTGAKSWSIDRDKCVQCGACVDACIKFKALSTTDDDGEKGIVTLVKE